MGILISDLIAKRSTLSYLLWVRGKYTGTLFGQQYKYNQIIHTSMQNTFLHDGIIINSVSHHISRYFNVARTRTTIHASPHCLHDETVNNIYYPMIITSQINLCYGGNKHLASLLPSLRSSGSTYDSIYNNHYFAISTFYSLRLSIGSS